MTPLSLAEAQAWLARHTPRLPAEPVKLVHALGRTLAEPVIATALPPAPTAAIAGLATTATATDGASDYAPLPIDGTPVEPGQPMPPGTDAVLPPEWHDAGAALMPIPPGHGVTAPGHDAPAGWTLPAGTVLGPLHIAILDQLGHTTVAAIRRPHVAPCPPMLSALATQAGAVIAEPPDLILAAHPLATRLAIRLAIRPGDDAALGVIDGTPAVRLPAHPLAAATLFAVLVAPALRRMAGLPEPSSIPARLTRKIASTLGQTDVIRVHVVGHEATPLGPAEHGSLVAGLPADGLVLVPDNSEGHPPGATIQVHPL